MTTIDENGMFVMDDDYAPKNSPVPITEKVGVTKYVIIEYIGHMGDQQAMILERNEEFDNLIKENSEIHVIAEGECYCSLSELIYAVQSPTRQLYRAAMADVKELLEERFTTDDEYMRNLCNSIIEEEKE